MRLRKIKWLVQITKAIRGRIGSWTLSSLFSAQSFPYSFPRPFSSIISITNAARGLRSKAGSPCGVADREGFQSCPDLPGGWDWYKESLEPRIVVGRWVCGMWRYTPKGGWNHKVPSTSLMAQMVRNPPACRRLGFNPWVRKILRGTEWLSTPVFLPGEFHRQRRPGGLYSPWGYKELDMTEWRTQLPGYWIWYLFELPRGAPPGFLPQCRC